MLRSLIGYVRGAGLDGRWAVIEGDAEFFRITKRLNNRLHGVQATAGPWARRSAPADSADHAL
jgi:trehalose synthase